MKLQRWHDCTLGRAGVSGDMKEGGRVKPLLGRKGKGALGLQIGTGLPD